MVWGKSKTLAVFYLSFVIALLCGIASLALLKQTKDSNDRELYYIFFLVVGTGVGCLWFRLFSNYVIWSHGILHTIVLVFIILGRKNLFDIKLSDAFQRYAIDLYAIGLYVVQYILSFHFVVFRYGQTKSERAWRTGFHSFCGTIVYFACVIDGTLRVHVFPAPNNKNASNDNATARVLLCFAFGVFTWYMLLNPYFDWRRMQAMRKRPTMKKRSGKHSGQRSASRSSTGSRSSMARRSSPRPATKGRAR